MMPKGVEHLPNLRHLLASNRVPSSLMPKGVEHSLQPADQTAYYDVPSSLMPKGVEHLCTPANRIGCRVCAVIFDVERR